jgi:hypothetical protein
MGVMTSILSVIEEILYGLDPPPARRLSSTAPETNPLSADEECAVSDNAKQKKQGPGGRAVQLKGRIDDGTADGIYSNIASIMMNRSEFYIDFGRMVPGRQEVKVHARIITSPAHAKELARVLTRNIEDYEKKFGTIPGDPSDTRKVGF